MTERMEAITRRSLIAYLKDKPEELAVFKEETEKIFKDWWKDASWFIVGIAAAMLLATVLNIINDHMDKVERIVDDIPMLIAVIVFWYVFIYLSYKKKYAKRHEIIREAEWGY